MTSGDQIKELMSRANLAITSGQREQAGPLLREVKILLEPGPHAGPNWAVATIQAALMALMAGDRALAEEFAIILQQLVVEYLQEVRKEKELRDLSFTIAYIAAFVPGMRPPPPVSRQSLDAYRTSGTELDRLENILESFIMVHVRPKLDRAGWDRWDCPPDVERGVKYWAAKTFSDIADALVSGRRFGQAVKDAESLASAGLGLLEGLPPGPDALRVRAEIYDTLGRCCYVYGDSKSIRRGVSWAEQSIEIAGGIGDQALAALAGGNLACSLMKQAEYDIANAPGGSAIPEGTRQSLIRAEALLKQAGDANRAPGREARLAENLVNLGGLYITLKEWQKAEETLYEARDIAAAAGRSDLLPAIVINLGDLLKSRKKWTDAEDILRPLARSVNEGTVTVASDQYVLLLGHFGDVLRRNGNAAEGREYLEAAIEKLESYGHTFVSAYVTGSGAKLHLWIYEALIDCCATLCDGRPELAARAFDAAEKVRWLALTSFLRYRDLKLPGQPADPLLEEEARLLGQIRDLALSEADRPYDPARLEAILRRLEEIWARLEPRYPDYVAIRRQKPAAAEDVGHFLDDAVPVLVEYCLGEQSDLAVAIVFCRGNKMPYVVRLPGSPGDMMPYVRRMYDCACRPERPVDDFNDASQQIYRWLIEPVKHLIPGNAGICIVPSGALHNVPFGALYDGRQYLVQQHPVAISPGVSALRWWRNKNRLGSESCLVLVGTEDLQTLERAAKHEIGPLFARHRTVTPGEMAGGDFLDTFLRGQGPDRWDVVHIVTHGTYCADNPLDSGLIMGKAAGGGDRMIKAIDIFGDCRLDASLVFLNSCETGINYVATGNELFGIDSALLFGGASSVIASLWLLRQDAGAYVTRRFYELWRGTPGPGSKIKALQAAQQEAMAKKQLFGLLGSWGHPYFWAVYQLYGDWR